jgi:hypothetical protein
MKSLVEGDMEKEIVKEEDDRERMVREEVGRERIVRRKPLVEDDRETNEKNNLSPKHRCYERESDGEARVGRESEWEASDDRVKSSSLKSDCDRRKNPCTLQPPYYQHFFDPIEHAYISTIVVKRVFFLHTHLRDYTTHVHPMTYFSL